MRMFFLAKIQFKANVPVSLQTFPSGHTANSFAPAIFLALFLNAKLKVLADYTTNFLLFGVVVSPLIGAGLVAVTMYISHVSQRSGALYVFLIKISNIMPLILSSVCYSA